MSELLTSIVVWLSSSFPAELSTAGYAIGVLTIVISLRTRFDIIAGQDIPEELRIFRLGQLTSGRKYRLGISIYFFFIFCVYSFIVLLLSRIELSKVAFLDLGDVDFGDNPDSLALYVALAFSGIIPNVRYLNSFEYFFRNLGQRYSGIPTDHNRIFEKIRISEIQEDITDKDIGLSLLKREIESATRLVGSDTIDELRKCKLILSRLSNPEKSTIEFDLVTVRVKDLFETVLDSIRDKVERSQGHLKGLVAVDPKDSSDPIASRVERDIRGWFRALSYMLGCAVIADANVKESSLSEILKGFGFSPKDTVRSDLIERFHRAVFYSFCIQIVFNVIAYYAVKVSDYPIRLLPSGLVNSFTLAAIPFLATAICTKVYLFVREKKINNETWYAGNGRIRITSMLLAAGLSLGSLLCIPYFELISRFAEANEFSTWTFHTSPREYLTIFAQIFGYPVCFVLVLIFFAESERSAAHDTRLRNKLYSRNRIIRRAISIMVVFLVTTLLLADGSTRFIVENPTYLIPDDVLSQMSVDDIRRDLTESLPYYFAFIGVQSLVMSSIFCASYVIMTFDSKWTKRPT